MHEKDRSRSGMAVPSTTWSGGSVSKPVWVRIPPPAPSHGPRRWTPLLRRLPARILGRMNSAFGPPFEPGQLVRGVVRRLGPAGVILDLGGGIQGLLPAAEQAPGERYAIEERLRAVVLELRRGTVASPIVILSRAREDFVHRLLEAEVPEIAAGRVIVSALVREAGVCTKIAVHSEDPQADPVTICRGTNHENLDRIVSELRGERVDVVRWSGDPLAFIGSALLLGADIHAEQDSSARKALVVVADDQLSPVIGRKGHNLRLAARLTGWDIDVMTRSELQREIDGQ
jgi:N utilization substance protein A